MNVGTTAERRTSIEDAQFCGFVAARSPALLRTACLLTSGDRDAGQDLLQDALADAFLRWHRIDDARAREGYVRRILIRKASKHWAKPNLLEKLMGRREPETPSPTESVDLAIDVKELLRVLSARQRAVVVLKYYEDMSEAAIADLLGCSTGSVKVHAHRALERLEQRLPDNYRPRAARQRG